MAAARIAIVAMPHMAFEDGSIVALRDAKILGDEAQHVDFGLVEFAVGGTDAEEEIDHVVAGAVVGVDFDLEAYLVDGNVFLHHLLEHLKHLFSTLFTIVLKQETLDEVEFAALDFTVGFHDGGDEDHEGGVDVLLRSGVAVRTVMGGGVVAVIVARDLVVGRDGFTDPIAEECSNGASDGPSEAREEPFEETAHVVGVFMVG